MTLDGRIASDTGDSKWISSAESRLAVHRLRSWMDAVMVGSGTLEADDPTLTARGVDCRRQPLRVVIDPGLSLRHDAALVRTVEEGPVLAVCTGRASEERVAEVRSWGVGVAVMPGRPEPSSVAGLLAGRGVQNLLLEGGARLAGAWWSAELVDKVVAYISPRVLSGESPHPPLWGLGSETVAAAVELCETEVTASGADVCVAGYVREAY
jgi:diaminohydroxyphosphoribosylaminopyrimidine deaminase/5-amino-6-(5-phosphoribosylamino)uracil reductase